MINSVKLMLSKAEAKSFLWLKPYIQRKDGGAWVVDLDGLYDKMLDETEKLREQSRLVLIEYWERADANGDGLMDYNEFVDLMNIYHKCKPAQDRKFTDHELKNLFAEYALTEIGGLIQVR